MTLKLPKIRGRYLFNTPLSKSTWLKVGGPADVLYKPADIEDLSDFLKNKPQDLLIFPLGLGSNLLVRDGGIRGAVVKLGKEFAKIQKKGDYIVSGTAALDRNVALFAANAGLTGFEFLASIPGTIGGALKMNAGCYGSEIKDILVSAKAITMNGEIKEYSPKELMYTYRSCGLKEDVIFVEATLRPTGTTSSALVHDQINVLLKKREETQPVGEKTGGSTFKNPPEQSAWKLIDQVGGRGLHLGGAMFSEKHSNFILNTGSATAKEIEDLAEDIRKKVLKQTGIELVWEVIRVGEHSS